MIADIKEFEKHIPELKRILSRRKSSWTLTTLEWEDVESILLTRLWQKFHLYEPEKGPLENWANTLISRGMYNLLRDNLYKYQKPCITAGPSGGSCVYNLPDEGCGYTKSKTKCSECPLYRKWEKKKQSLYNIKTSLPLDYHNNEIQNVQQEDFIDFDSSKKVIDEKILKQLNAHDAMVYKLLFIDNLSIQEVGKKMKYKKQGVNKVPGYQVIKKLIIKFKNMAKDIIQEEAK